MGRWYLLKPDQNDSPKMIPNVTPTHVALDFINSGPKAAALNTILDALGDARFVGGAVRDAIAGRPIGDLDVATPVTPDEVIQRLRAASIKVVPTGLSHGTVTAVLDGQVVEVTTLRRDVSTDGRHATIAYTTDWLEDAARRDFTMNAIYADRDGMLYDPMRGWRDLMAKRVRFIGEPRARIAEDFLRILRFFRFSAFYGQGFDEAGLLACAESQAGLDYLSAERVRAELLKLLGAPDPMPSLYAMAKAGILQRLLPGPLQLDALGALILAEHILDQADPVRRLGVLSGPAALLGERLRLSKAETDRIEHFQSAPNAHHLDELALRRLVQIHGHAAVLDRILIDRPKNWRELHGKLTAWDKPHFPLKGDDALKLGLKGRAVGQALRMVEDQWIESDFTFTRDVLLGLLDQTVRGMGE
jgi:tRNA nucleotidyltransferase/poly(A) polymerase